ncbi:M3 family metallopeptidase [Limimaricola pyoseonensis]|uniref:Peptidyl-dipeptidase Dcp Metallo peptidase. MEROPS family M03A n=1 Tax=Limimaricola pyoseonensis TaxID=521013 RepID=A0A1G7C8Q3_9RHOB|nr:M3 family metallopeptidase [Limimaricola pyoseonensis]SDE35593.1 peptidyl-dipeptidase Dcp Metallo peptidase. MEROPS family M03A [Limimaricola pyoseonensis]
MTNPLLEDWDTPFGLPPYDRITEDHWAPAVEAELSRARAAVAAIADNPEPPSFDNTVAALERADLGLGRVLGAFYSVAGADSTPGLQALQRDFAPKLSAYGSEVISNAALFARIEDLWDRRETLGLTDEEARVLMLTRRGFVRSGAQLEGEDAKRMAEIKSRLSVLGTQFAQNLLADEADWSMPLSPEALAELPAGLRSAATSAGGEKGPVITLSRSLIVPFLQYSPDRAARRKAYEAWAARGARGGETDNRAIAAEVLRLREERAKLLGHDDFASYKLETEMAKTPDAVREMLHAVWTPARELALKDAAIYEEMLRADGHDGPLEPWDWRYYAEARRRAEHEIDDGTLKPYLQLDRMIEAAFSVAHRLFGIKAREIEAPLYHPDARAFEITRDGRHLAVFVGDWFARPSKRSGAWCSAMRQQHRLSDEEVRPLVVNVCNFAKPGEGEPALLSYDDARTLFHEFGHALHQMLSDVTFESISGTSVARDFVELPSQLLEHWLEVPEVLRDFATHAETGEPMPEALMQKMLAAKNFDQGFASIEQTASAIVDLEFHCGPAPADPMQRQAEILEGLGIPHAIRMRHATPHFAHVFTGDGYSAGYYSYQWSEMMDEDAFAAFEETGDVFDPETARKLEEHVLSRGGAEEPGLLYERFRGRMPGVEALLKGRGLAA